VNPAALPNRHILLVEDDRDLAAFMREVLAAAGFEVTVAGDGRTGLAELERRPFALVVLDLMLPEMDGIEFRLRQRQHSSQWNTPALVVSAHYNLEKLAASVGAEAFLAKPFSGEDLMAAVHHVLGAASSRPV
jgi:DNA-binding response OmpR family regulator